MEERLLKSGWILHSERFKTYFKNGWFVRLEDDKVVDIWKTEVFKRIKK